MEISSDNFLQQILCQVSFFSINFLIPHHRANTAEVPVQQHPCDPESFAFKLTPRAFCIKEHKINHNINLALLCAACSAFLGNTSLLQHDLVTSEQH